MNKIFFKIFFVVILSASIFSQAKIYAEDGEQVSFSTPKRLLMLDGDKGSVACRIYGDLMSSTIPTFSAGGTLECATRSLLRIKNLTAVRGERGACMIGPADYLGNLEDPHQYLYTISSSKPPILYRWPLDLCEQQKPLNTINFDDSLVTVVKANWIRGTEKDVMNKLIDEYQVTSKNLSQSLFLHPGFLELETPLIELKEFDPRNIDLSSFKAKLYKNAVPFSITKCMLPAKDDYRLVTYLYESGYADWQMEQGSGLFLEKHEFSQIITPITEDSKGFVMLARVAQDEAGFELIGFQIPFGWTLLIENGCIHGDTTLKGFFLMGMTSSHVTMRTANTVFLKCKQSKKNVRVNLSGEDFPPLNLSLRTMEPIVLPYDCTGKEFDLFHHKTKGMNFIFRPFSYGYWLSGAPQ